MTGGPSLGGHRVLVVEDEYYIASDFERALESAGANVTGTCPTEEAAMANLTQLRPDAVLLDINLGRGASFKLAEYLKDNAIPFIFVTGYDQVVIPAEFDAVERIEKPTEPQAVVGALSKLLEHRA